MHERQEPQSRRYARRVQELTASAKDRVKADTQIGNARLFVGVATIVMAFAIFAFSIARPAWLLLPVLTFAALVVRHGFVLRALDEDRRALAFFERALARTQGQWSGSGETGARFADPDHPYADDLDLFGDASLYQLLSTTRTQAGAQALADALLTHLPANEIRRRQEAVLELRDNPDFRERIGLSGLSTDPNGAFDARWMTEPSVEPAALQRARILAASLAGIMAPLAVWLAIAFLANLVAAIAPEIAPPDLQLPLRAVAAMGLVNGLFALRWRKRVRHILSGSEHAADELALMRDLFVVIESESFQSSCMRELHNKLRQGRVSAAREVRKLNRMMELLDSRDNVALRIFGPLLLWTTQISLALEAWRRRNRTYVTEWVWALGEVESLTAFATYASEHPDDCFPEILDVAPQVFARGLGHPLLNRDVCVRNDVELTADLRLLVVSGSNMSGKTTFLRAIGVNMVLGMAGGPVYAHEMQLSPMPVGASVRSRDSLQKGVSKFYAEVLRLRDIKTLAEAHGHVLFLIDELLQGTNSHDRAIGAAAIVRKLLERGGIGLVTTHDLALSRIADELGTAARNVHFEDQIRDGRMFFDYKLRPGTVTTSNAVELLRRADLL